mmetsp:Transcript_11945/g.30489  ORF Transcript_11945/g.30489 Transcript_11945/m.30489 type:complete len:287 (+) Transcript_11945:459-1319(+)
MLSWLSSALQPYSRFAKCHCRSFWSSSERGAGILSLSSQSGPALALPSPFSLIFWRAWAMASPRLCSLALLPSNGSRFSLALSSIASASAMSKRSSNTAATLWSLALSILDCVARSNRGHSDFRVLSFTPVCSHTMLDGSQTSSFRMSTPVPVMMEAPRSMGTEKVFASVHTLPPTRSRASRTVTVHPCLTRCLAAAMPAGPAPTTTTERPNPIFVSSTTLGPSPGSELMTVSLKTRSFALPLSVDRTMGRHLLTRSLMNGLRGDKHPSAPSNCFSAILRTIFSVT